LWETQCNSQCPEQHLLVIIAQVVATVPLEMDTPQGVRTATPDHLESNILLPRQPLGFPPFPIFLATAGGRKNLKWKTISATQTRREGQQKI